MRILLVEPDPATAASVELMLRTEAINVDVTDRASEAVDLGKLYDFDAILLEIALPDASGYEVVRALRLAKIKTPILIVSGLAGVQDKVKALNAGADDYLVKPFHRDELVARVGAVVRRSKGYAGSAVELDGLVINLDRKYVEVDGAPVRLTIKEYQMLELLVMRRGAILTKEMFLNHLYGGLDEPEVKIIDVFICKLRKKLSAAAADGRQFISTVWGRGYIFAERPQPAELAA